MAYPTASDLVAASSVGELTSLDPNAQENLRNDAIRAIEAYCHQSFEPDPGVTRKLDGGGDPKLYLPKRLETLTALSTSLGELDSNEVDLTESGDMLFVTSVGGTYYSRALRSLQDLAAVPRVFPRGIQNVEVAGDWGWSSVPQDVFDALRMDMEDAALVESSAITDTVRAYRRLGLRGVSQGNLAVDMGAQIVLSDRVRRVLEPYVWHAQLGALA